MRLCGVCLMAEPMVYSVRLELENDGLFYVSLWSGVSEPLGSVDRMVTSWRSPSLADAMHDAGVELRSFFHEDLY